MKIKICGNKYNISQVAALKPDMMGFIFYEKSARCLIPEEVEPFMKDIAQVLKVGVFVNEKIDSMLKLVQRLNLDLIQLHGDESPVLCKELKKKVAVMKALDGNNKNLENEVKQYKDVVDFFLIDNKGRQRGGTGEKFAWKNIESINFPHPFILAGGIGPGDVKNIAKIKTHHSFYGIDLNSGFESAAGTKNTELLNQFIKQLV